MKNRVESAGFTIVELLIVIVVIAILAAIGIVAYNGIQNQAKESSLKSDLEAGAKQLHIAKITNNSFPANTNALQKSATTTFDYTYTATTFCLGATSSTLTGKSFYITESGGIQAGACPPAISDGVAIQTVTSTNCPSTRTRAMDARDSRTYWIQKLADNKCWMMTNLAYAGGGVNTYGDTKTLTNGTAGAATFTVASYYIPTTGSNPSFEPTSPTPSTSTDGGTTSPQYGYLYNWCGAMGGQAGTNACLNATTPAASTSISVCPAGWRLPAGDETTGDFAVLNNTVNGGASFSDAGLLTNWYLQRSGRWNNGFGDQGSHGYFWSTVQHSSSGVPDPGNARYFYTRSTYVVPSTGYSKSGAVAVRCIAI